MKVVLDRVLIQQDPPTGISEGGIIMIAGKEEYPNFGTVLEIGPKVKDVAVGDRVIFKRKPETALDPWSREGEDFWGKIVLPEDHILAIVDGVEEAVVDGE